LRDSAKALLFYAYYPLVEADGNESKNLYINSLPFALADGAWTRSKGFSQNTAQCTHVDVIAKLKYPGLRQACNL